MTARLITLRQRLAQALHRPPPAEPYDPDRYWERRAPELIDTYDHPETWPEKGWMRAGVEEQRVPALLADAGAQSALVVGAGSGRQYGFLATHGLELSGFDIAPTLVEECQKRYPSIPTSVDSVVGAHERHSPADAVVTSAVLQHVPRDDIDAAIDSVRQMARRLVVIRELTWLVTEADYLMAHDYEARFADWRLVHREVTDEADHFRVELMAWAAP